MNDIHFQTPSLYANIKHSQNSAAKFTLTHFCPPQDGSCASGSDGVENPHDVSSTKSSQDVKLLYKNQLLNIAVYSCEMDKAKVSVDGEAFEGPATVATMSLLCPANSHKEGMGLYKKLLRELGIKEGFGLHVFSITEPVNRDGPKFVSSVNFGGEVFTDGQKRKTRKLAEMCAARIAFTILKERKGNQSPWVRSSAHHSDKEDN